MDSSERVHVVAVAAKVNMDLHEQAAGVVRIVGQGLELVAAGNVIAVVHRDEVLVHFPTQARARYCELHNN